MDDKISAEQIFDKIFTIMQRLYDAMNSDGGGAGNHLQVFEIFAELGRTLVDADRASFWRWDKHAHKLITAADNAQIAIDDTTGLVGRALAEKRALVTNDPYPVLVMPVANCRGEIVGAFQVINKLDAFDETADIKRLSIAAFICGIALESEIFLADSQCDKLTDLKNRLGFQNDFQARFSKVLADKISLAVIIGDIDFFKRVNDTYGHNAGDALLIHVAKLLAATIRARDCLYRWGGEEFVIVLDGATVAEAVCVAERIRLAVMNSVCRFDGAELRVTMSLGCVAFNPALSIEENVNLADERLYRAKQTGRNKVVAVD